jgi:hypothetical protein
VVQVSALQAQHLPESQSAPSSQWNSDLQVCRHSLSKGLYLLRERQFAVLVLRANAAMLGCRRELKGFKATRVGLHRGVEHRPQDDHDVRCNSVDARARVPARALAAYRGEMVCHALRRQVGQPDIAKVIENVVLEHRPVGHHGGS